VNFLIETALSIQKFPKLSILIITILIPFVVLLSIESHTWKTFTLFEMVARFNVKGWASTMLGPKWGTISFHKHEFVVWTTR
jgi:hypothetical protein